MTMTDKDYLDLGIKTMLVLRGGPFDIWGVGLQRVSRYTIPVRFWSLTGSEFGNRLPEKWRNLGLQAWLRLKTHPLCLESLDKSHFNYV